METKIKKRKKSKVLKFLHKWIGLVLAFFLFMFALSGIFLNHRRAISSIDVPRSILSDAYQYKNWNKGAIKGSLKLSSDTILLYGGNGIWMTDSNHQQFSPFTEGLKSGADNNIINNILKTSSGDIFAVATFSIYKLNQIDNKWIDLSDLIDSKERFSDIAIQNDSLVLMTRSHLYVSNSPYTSFHKIELLAPVGYKKEASWFRTMWTLHSGELFGMPGKLIVDMVGVLTIILCVTGVILTFFPSIIRRKKKKEQPAQTSRKLLKESLKWHNRLGAWFFAIFLIVVISGMFLRPPLLIPIVRGKSKPVAGTMLDSDNPWNDKLRSLVYDRFDKTWIIYSSDGFFETSDLNMALTKIKKSPPVSVMGMTVFQQTDTTEWIVGSFSGIYCWNKQTRESINLYTGIPYVPKRGIPTFDSAVSGYVDSFGEAPIVFEYGKGATPLNPSSSFTPMPDSFRDARMSLWHLSLEVHVGRIYAFLPGILGDLFIFLAGTLSLIVFISGYIIYRRHHWRRKVKN